ncbi:MAG TPA: hypothetical protein VF773_16345 [Verrucomicrobiae bacterium]
MLRSPRTGLYRFATLLLVSVWPGVWAANVFLPLPGLDFATQKSLVLQCSGNLLDINYAARMWSIEHNGQVPGSLFDFTNRLSSAEVFYCPAHLREPAVTNWNDVAWEDIDYVWKGSSAGEEGAAVECRVHTSVARFDGEIVLGRERDGWPYFMAGPIGQVTTPGGSARFEVVIDPITAAGPLSYQWRREDLSYVTNLVFIEDGEAGGFLRTNRTAVFSVTPLANETNSFVVLSNLQTNDMAYYAVAVSNSLGRLLSRRASLRIRDEALDTAEWSRTICGVNLSQIGLLARSWATEHGDVLPGNFAEMTNRFNYPMFGRPMVLFCRADTGRSAPASWVDFDFAETSYEVVVARADEENLYAVFCRCKIHGYYVEVSGRVVREPRFTAPIFFMNNELSLPLELFAGRSNVLESSSNLTAWTTVKAFSNTNGPVDFSVSKTASHLFYRLRLE